MTRLLNVDLAVLRTHDQLVEQAKKERAEHLQLMIDHHCPVKVGDIVENTGYTNRGKKFKVTKVGFKDQYGNRMWTAYGYIQKKDGTLGSLVGEWYEHIDEEAKP